MRGAVRALAAYAVIALVATWPLARGLGRDVAWDLGDPVLVIWAIAWDCEQLLRILRGDLTALGGFFNANIFYPAPLTLAYSEHFIPQALQILPVYAIGRNPILCYNLLLLSTFALSGLGMYLFVRELTANSRAAFVAGVLFAFAPYRIPQSSHLQVLSSQWMPFVLYGLRRYFDTTRVRPLIGAAVALVVQSLSCGYYLLYFAPFAVAYAVWEAARRRVRRRCWGQLSLAAVAVAASIAPFLLPYAAMRQQLDVARARGEVVRYSADVYSYVTAFAGQPVWGPVANALHKPEGDLFPGVVPLALMLMGLFVWRGPQDSEAVVPVAPPYPFVARHRWIAPLVAATAIGHTAAAVATLAWRRLTIDFGLFVLHMSNVNQLLIRAGLLFAVLLIISPGARERTGRFFQTRGVFLVGLVAAAWLSLGPSPQALGRPVQLFGAYGLLHDYVPGFDGVRVPARFGMIVVLMLAVLAGYGAAVVVRGVRGSAVMILVTMLALGESLALPFTVNGAEPPRGFNAPEARLYRPARAPAVYHQVAALDRNAVIAELPLGQPDFDLRAMYYSISHWRRLLNGYSGFYPRHYGQLAVALSDVPRYPQVALDALRALRATHVVVHERAYLDEQGMQTTTVLRQRGARELFREGGDVLLELPR